jgi:mRNA-degrading endonuclease RelE of RelBE toxin-antitoxin system
MKIIHTDDFKKNLEKLLSATTRSFFSQQTRFENNPRHPSLQTKIKGPRWCLFFSDWEKSLHTIFFTAGGNVTFFAIGHRKDIYR